jgi:UDP-N-acetylmuramoylalanine--D-glutamate ligase
MMRHTEQKSSQDFAGTRALVVGLAREGTALARFLAERGARVTVTDIKPAERLADNVAALADLPVRLALGGHADRLLDAADIVFVSPGVPLQSPFLAKARRRRLPLSSETRLFTRLCPAPIVGVTGSSGKSTTTALVGAMLNAAGRRVWVGGNIGSPLISHLAQIRATDVVVMELSSFQLEFFGAWDQLVRNRPPSESGRVLFDPVGWSPIIAAVLNISPNHLDRHETMDAYIAAKTRILASQAPFAFSVLNLDDAITRGMGQRGRYPAQRTVWFSMEQAVAEGAYLKGDSLVLRWAGKERNLCDRQDLRLLGRHNLANALAACAVAAAEAALGRADPEPGVPDIESIGEVLTSFSGIEHRLELVRTRNGVQWYNDSIATSPERTSAALRSFESPIVLLAGGRDKHLPWDDMAALALRKARHVVLFGEATDLIKAAMKEQRNQSTARVLTVQIHEAGTLEGAVGLAARLAEPGDVVLLSPGGTSFDAYPDFVARGEHFRHLVQELG